MATTNEQIRHLPYGTLHKLAQLLDIPGQRNWKALISAMPSNLYKPEEVSRVYLRNLWGVLCQERSLRQGVLKKGICTYLYS